MARNAGPRLLEEGTGGLHSENRLGGRGKHASSLYKNDGRSNNKDNGESESTVNRSNEQGGFSIAEKTISGLNGNEEILRKPTIVNPLTMRMMYEIMKVKKV